MDIIITSNSDSEPSYATIMKPLADLYFFFMFSKEESGTARTKQCSRN